MNTFELILAGMSTWELLLGTLMLLCLLVILALSIERVVVFVQGLLPVRRRRVNRREFRAHRKALFVASGREVC